MEKDTIDSWNNFLFSNVDNAEKTPGIIHSM